MKKCWLVLFFLILTIPLYADVVYYKDGTMSEGKIIKETKNIIIIREIVDGAQCETEAPQSLVERIERGSASRPQPLSKEAIKKELVEIPKEVHASVVQLSDINEDLEPENLDAEEWLVERDAGEIERERLATQVQIRQEAQQKKIEQERLAKQVQARQEAQQKKIEQEQEANEKAVRQKDKKEPLLIQKTKSGQKLTKLCQYSLGRRKDTTSDFGNKVAMSRVEISVVVPNNTSFAQLQNLFDYLLQKEVRGNKKLDAFWVSAYREAYGEESIPLAYGIWAPPEGWDDFKHTQDKDQYQWQYRLIKR